MPLPALGQPLVRIPEAFHDPEWRWDLKFDGFRALVYIEGGACWRVSGNGHA